MTDDLRSMTDSQLEAALRALGSDLAYPAPGVMSSTVSNRVAALPTPSSDVVGRWLSLRPVRRSVVLAVAAVLLLAALVAAAVLGVPGIRIVFGPAPPASPSGTAGPSASPVPVPPERLGATLSLGERTDLASAAAAAGFEPRLPADPDLGPPDAVFVEDGRITLVWATRRDLPATAEPSVGLLITEFPGAVDRDAYTKMVNAGTRVEQVSVGGQPGYWLSGREHYVFYTDDEGVTHDKAWRVVGEALIWFDGELTFRVESALGRDASIHLAESLLP